MQAAAHQCALLEAKAAHESSVKGQEASQLEQEKQFETLREALGQLDATCNELKEKNANANAQQASVAAELAAVEALLLQERKRSEQSASDAELARTAASQTQEKARSLNKLQRNASIVDY